jgi:hypothetical protein
MREVGQGANRSYKKLTAHCPVLENGCREPAHKQGANVPFFTKAQMAPVYAGNRIHLQTLAVSFEPYGCKSYTRTSASFPA